MLLHIKRNNTLIASVEIDEQTVLNQEFMGMDKITATFITPAPIPVQVDDYVEYNGSKYSIKSAPELQILDSTSYQYTIIFYGEAYLLYDKMIMHLGRTRFSYTGTPFDLLGLLIDNMHEYDLAWAIGDVELIDEPITFIFDEQSCGVALSDIAEAFKLEYYIENYKIHLLRSIGTVKNMTLRYGRGNGLYTLTRQPVDQPYATEWFGFGGNHNIPDNYREGQDRITFDGNPVVKNVELYGRKQGSVTFEDVFPNRTSTVTASETINHVTDDTLDFDLNSQFITDGGAKIVFKTGDLGGNEFPIISYNHTTKTIRFGTNKEETGYELPNDVVHAAVGDKYTLVGIVMPQSYVDAAEAEVKARTIAHAEAHSHPPVSFILDVDEKYIRELNLVGQIKPGDRIRVTATELGLDAPLRVQSISLPLVNPAKIAAVISEVVQYSRQERIAKEIKKNLKGVSKAQAVALYARQVADEIANAAILEQFKRTYIGERAILTGAFVAGNPEDGEVAGINGTGSTLEEVRFWAGGSFENRAVAPFRVLQNGKVYMFAAEILDGCKIGNFLIEDGIIRSSDYSGSGTSGMWISDDGIVSRNARATLIPASTGIQIEGSFFGETSSPGTITPTIFCSPISAGVVGIRRSELTADALANTNYCRGVYGGFFSSIKNIGGRFEAVRWSGSGIGSEPMTYSDSVVIVNGERSNVNLPEAPDLGMIVEIKNGRSASITITSLGEDTIITKSNASVTSITVNSGEVAKLIYTANGKRWVLL